LILYLFWGISSNSNNSHESHIFVDLYRFNKGLGMKINSKKYAVFVAHNPKVVGSNPAPATSNSALSP
jgi:hypothetical protein